ncbi:hypothetical protein [Metamycoplasma neophronis]|uniref:Uncharacterized protein n=1 Tax=Metamycoplasma neophronis TaxID=872983 RepID=A0ABY2Z1Q3_9BACT|nr:hypothetical protein [Metamycoplasma neophronis]TPR54742.1 hypothetical protein FJR74_00515 [Metamycoplasma neophronis]
MQIEEIRQLITSTLRTIAGIVGFKQLTEDNEVSVENDGLIVSVSENNPDIINIAMGLIILSNISAKNIVEEIHSIVTYYLEQRNLHLGCLSIYIKGTK